MGAVPAVAPAPAVPAFGYARAPLAGAPALVAHPNGAVVPADEPDVVAARADHFAAKGLAYGKRSADSEAYYGGVGYTGYSGLGYGYGYYGKRSADSEAYYGGVGYAGYGGLGYSGYGGYYGKRSADSEAYYGGVGYAGYGGLGYSGYGGYYGKRSA